MSTWLRQRALPRPAPRHQAEHPDARRQYRPGRAWPLDDRRSPVWSGGELEECGAVSKSSRPQGGCRSLGQRGNYVVQCHTLEYVDISWLEVDAEYIRTRSSRYPGAVDIEVEWTREALRDINLKRAEPDPKSIRGSTIRFVGFSSSAGRLLVVIGAVDDGTLYGYNAWPATGADRHWYEQEEDDD